MNLGEYGRGAVLVGFCLDVKVCNRRTVRYGFKMREFDILDKRDGIRTYDVAIYGTDETCRAVIMLYMLYFMDSRKACNNSKENRE